MLAVFSCGNAQEATAGAGVNQTDESEETEEEEVTYREGEDGRVSQKTFRGVVYNRTSTEGCSYVIIAEIDGFEQTFVPLDLKSEFKKDKLDVEFSYVMSRRPSECTLGTPIIIGSIESIR